MRRARREPTAAADGEKTFTPESREQLAKDVVGIDVVISGHSHTVLKEAIIVDDRTPVVQAGKNGEYLGELVVAMDGGKPKVVSYNLLPIDDTIAGDRAIAEEIEKLKQGVTARRASLSASSGDHLTDSGGGMRAKTVADWVIVAAGAALVLATALPARAQAPGGPAVAMDGQWHFVVAPYMWFTGLKGDVSVKGLPEVPIEKSFSDIWSDFDFGLLGHFEGRKDRFGFGVDFVYTNLGAPVAAGRPILGRLDVKADVRQFFTEGFGFYRVARGGRADNPASLDVLVGARYYGTSSKLSATGVGGSTLDSPKKDLQWVDGLAGVRFRAPLGSRVALIGRGDVAGFGSKLTWNLEGDLATRVSEHWTLGAGWRHLSIDYDKGSGTDRKLFDVAYDGPRAWFSYAW